MDNKKTKSLKEKVHRIIFEADTFYGQLFDILLLFTIITSLILVMLESVASIHEKYGVFLHNFEWFDNAKLKCHYFHKHNISLS